MATLPSIPDFIQLEHDVATILTSQELHGWYFDEDAARELAQALYSELDGLNRVLRKRYPYVAGREFTPKRSNRTTGYVGGATVTKLKEFSPTSRDDIAWVMKNKWQDCH